MFIPFTMIKKQIKEDPKQKHIMLMKINFIHKIDNQQETTFMNTLSMTTFIEKVIEYNAED